MRASSTGKATQQTIKSSTRPNFPDVDAIFIGCLCAKSASVAVLEKYITHEGSGDHFERAGHHFDTGSSAAFGLGTKGSTIFLTRALGAVSRQIGSIPYPRQVHHHLPDGLGVRVFRD